MGQYTATTPQPSLQRPASYTRGLSRAFLCQWWPSERGVYCAVSPASRQPQSAVSPSRQQHTQHQHEVAVQRGAPLREEEGRGGEEQEEVPGQSPCHRGEVTQSPYWRFGQEEVPGSL